MGNTGSVRTDILKALSLEKSEAVTVMEKKGRFCDDRTLDMSALVYIESGRVGVYDLNGTLLSVLRPGDIYGISNLYSGEELPSRLKCEEESTLLMFSKEAVRSALASNAAAMETYCRILNEKISFLIGRIASLTAPSNRERLALYLTGDRRPVFESREQLASYLGMGRSALFRELKFFEENGCIRTSGHDIEVLSADQIRSYL